MCTRLIIVEEIIPISEEIHQNITIITIIIIINILISSKIKWEIIMWIMWVPVPRKAGEIEEQSHWVAWIILICFNPWWWCSKIVVRRIKARPNLSIIIFTNNNLKNSKFSNRNSRRKLMRSKNWIYIYKKTIPWHKI